MSGQPPEPKIPAWSRYTKVKTLGAGGFGQVYLVTPTADNKRTYVNNEMVLKRVYLQEDDEVLEAVENEIKVLQLMQHDNVVEYIDHYYDDENYINIVMEYCPLGDLDRYIERRKKEKQPLTTKEVVFFSYQILSAVRHLHENNVLHRDLKPANIFLTGENILKVADFGISRVLATGSCAKTVIGTPHYLSPEVCESLPYTTCADMWSVGCIVYELITLEKCFLAQNMLAIVRKIAAGKYEPIPQQYSAMQPLLDRMLVVDPGGRATAAELVDEFFVPPDMRRQQSLQFRKGGKPGQGNSEPKGTDGDDGSDSELYYDDFEEEDD